jgi:hypothetical protein
VGGTSFPNPKAEGPRVEGENLEVDPPRRLVQRCGRCGILPGLKTWLETREELTTPGSLMFS